MEKPGRNRLLTLLLWIAILANFAVAIGSCILMFNYNTEPKSTGLCWCSICTLVNVLGLILLMRWRRNGFWLIVLSALLLSSVCVFLLKIDIDSATAIMVCVIFLLIILQLRKNGKSAWSQLEKGWDPQHCRHIYQLFAGSGYIILLASIIYAGFTSDALKKPNNDEYTSSPVPESKDSLPDVETPKVSEDYMDYREEPAQYLDSHSIWKEYEMSEYPDIHDLNKILMSSLRDGYCKIPSDICSNSKRLNQIRRRFAELERSIDRLNGEDRYQVRKILLRFINGSKLEPDIVIKNIVDALYYIRTVEASAASAAQDSAEVAPAEAAAPPL